jgi:membrane fusion protein, adhesin transport system
MLNISPKKIKGLAEGQDLSALEVLHTPRAAKVFTKWLLVLLVLIIIILLLPWQQNITGMGELTAFSPADRPQTVETAIAGRIEAWYFNEGDFVNAGDTLVRLSEIRQEFFDPQILQRLEEQMAAQREGIIAREERIEATQNQISALRRELQLRKNQQLNNIQQVRLNLTRDSADLVAEQVQYGIAVQQLDRQRQLFDQGLVSQRDWEQARVVFEGRRARVVELEARLATRLNELENAQIQMNALEAEFTSRINNALGALGQAQTDIAGAREGIAQLETRYMNIVVRQQQLILRAPQSGTVVRAQRTGIGETVSEGEALLSIMPFAPQLAVELYIRPMDIPLIDVGRPVRMEFEGWPALQFTGRPNLAIGTFGGIVRVIDAVDSPTQPGRFRILVTPDPDDDPWPPRLKVGSGVFGWVLLEEVPIWYEIWRQLNGFPPIIDDDKWVNVGERKIRR